MKKLLLPLLLLCFTAGRAQSDKYTKAMEQTLQRMDSAHNTADFQAVSAAFQRIGDAEKTQWLPYYYAGLALSIPAWNDARIDKDVNSEKIKAFCDKAEALAETNRDKSEIWALRNMAATQQMLVDPQSRWSSFGQEASGDLNKAMELDAANPRVYYLQGAGVFGTPEQFGGGKARAKPLLEKAVALFKADQPAELHPKWGQKQAEDMLAQCGQ